MFPVRQILIGMTELWTLRWAKSSEFPRFDRTLSSRNFHFILTILADHQVDDKAFQNSLHSSQALYKLAYWPVLLLLLTTSASINPWYCSSLLRLYQAQHVLKRNRILYGLFGRNLYPVLFSRSDFLRVRFFFYSCGSTNMCNSSCPVLE